MNYTAKFIDREKVATDVTMFRFEKPEGFRFIAGQYCLVTVPDMGYRDDRGLRRPFSIASSPLEKELMFVTKLSDSAMKRTMAEMAPGTAISLDEPLGSLVLPEATATPLVFLAGGVGIAPFRSLCRYAADAATGHSITLFYSARTPDETPFLEELQGIPGQSKQVAVAITMTRAEDPTKWSGLTGRLSGDMIKAQCAYWDRAFYYVAGPPAMADAMKQTLDNMGIEAGRIKVELFAGY